MDSVKDSYYLVKGAFDDFFHESDAEKKLASPSHDLNRTILGETQSTFAYHSIHFRLSNNLPKIDLSTFLGEHGD